MMGLLLGHSCIIIKWSWGFFFQKFAIWHLHPPPPLPPTIRHKRVLGVELIVRMIFIWSEFLLLVFLDKSNFCQNKMKPVGVVEVYATKFSQSCFYWKSRKVWWLFKICTAMNPKNHWVNNFCFNFGFWFLLYFKLPNWSLHFFLVCFCYWPNFFMKGDEGGIFSKEPTEKLCFCVS